MSLAQRDMLNLHELLEGDDWWDCPCGTGEGYWSHDRGSRARHANWHLEWDRGVALSSKVIWFDSLAIVTSESSMPERETAYRLGRLFQREKRYDFCLVPDPRTWRTELHQVLVAVHHHTAIGLLIGYQTFRYGLWDGIPARVPFSINSVDPVPEISGIWVARSYRRRGIATALVRAFADYANLTPAELCWNVPFSDDGKALALSITPGTVRVS
jgi:RimJ/RimL family protein N-acetyltransferase